MFRIKVPEQDQHTPGGYVRIEHGVWTLTSSPVLATTWPSAREARYAVDEFGAPNRVVFTGKIEEAP